MWPREERGPRWGWVGGMLGGTCWMLLASGGFFLAGDLPGGALAVLYYAIVTFMIFVLAPWRHPSIPVWVPYLAVIGASIVAAALMLWRYLAVIEPGEEVPLNLVFIVFPLMVPVFTFGNRRWNDIHRKPPPQEEQ